MDADQPLPDATTFFKPFLGLDRKLFIPRAFLKNISREIKSAKLLSPLGSEWQVEMEREGDGLFFSNGWKNFVEAHGIEIGYFLQFDYRGGETFAVTVFGLTSCSKDYASIDTHNSKGKTKTGREDGAEDIKNSRSMKPKQKEVENTNAGGESTRFVRRRFTRSQLKPSINQEVENRKPERKYIGFGRRPATRSQTTALSTAAESSMKPIINLEEVENRKSEGKCTEFRRRPTTRSQTSMVTSTAMISSKEAR